MERNRILFLTDYCLTPFEKIPSSGILCEDGKIIGIGGASAFSMYESGLEIVHLENCYAVPGFIDSHIHGIGAFDASLAAEQTEENLESMSRNLAKHGVTTFFPTIVSRPRDSMIRTVDKLTALLEQGCSNAEAPAIHIEGPFINKEKRGAQDPDSICDIDLGYAREMFQAGRNRIKLMTFAPELQHSEKLIELMLEYGIIPSMGHSMADEEQTLRTIDAGCTRCTYIFNGMPTLRHRKSSLTDVALTDDRVAVEIICDGAHIHRRIVDLTVRCKPKDKIIGISNAVTSVTPYAPDALQKIDSALENDTGIVKNQEGIITGGTMTLENSWLHLMNYANMDQALAAACFSLNPAINLGLYTRGEIRPGRRADITFFDSRTNTVHMTVVRGKIIYNCNNY